MMKKAKMFISVLVVAGMLMNACSTVDSPPQGSSTQSVDGSSSGSGAKLDNPSGVMTDVGTPRSQTLVVDMLNGRVANPDLFNPYVPGAVSLDAGPHQLLHGHLWEIDTMKGEQFPDLAATMPEAVEGQENTYTFKMRENLLWSDGEALDAHDVAFTFNMLLESQELAYGAVVRDIVKSCQALDDVTVEIVTNEPQPKLAQKFGVMVWGNPLYVVPEHVWGSESPASFTYSNPLSSGPYVLKDKDPQGYWLLYEKRTDWKNTAVGQSVGEPIPHYILFKTYGTEEKRIMAAIQNEIDILQDITPESWDILREKNSATMAWYQDFPYADMDDPCERGISFNCAIAPYDNADVRWALALATDIKNVSMATFGGMMRVSPIQVPPTEVLMNTYHKPMEQWLKDFTLEDGYKPFDENYAQDIVQLLTQQGIDGLPSTPEEMKNIFGVGWWKYDVDQAAKMLEKEGFTRNGKTWMTPEGKEWAITILAPADFEIQSMRLAFAVADSWKKFGIKATVAQQDGATFWNNEATGNFEVGSYWPACGIMPDTSSNMDHWNKKHIVPIGEQAPGNRNRWSNDRVSELLNELRSLPSDDPKVIEGITEICKEFVEGQPFMPMFGTSKFVPVNTHYWKGFQTSENAFEGPWWWWSQFKYYTPHLEPTGK